MKHNFKRFLCLTLAFVMVFGLFPANVFATGEETTNAAQIGDTGYETLEAAFTAAADGDTIVLLRDAEPALTSQRAITKAAVIDLGGHTLTLAEDDLYFGTTTFMNGTIVVDPSVKASTAVFWMFEGQTLTFDKVEIVATGVTGTYLIGINGGTNSAVNLLNGSKITIENTTQAKLSAVICDNGTGNSVVIEDSTINVANIEGRFYLGGVSGSIDVKDSNVKLNGVKEGFYLRANQTLAVEGTSDVAITLNDTNGRYGINLTDTTAAYTKAETATVVSTDNAPKPVYAAMIGTQGYETLAAAVAAAESGATITLMSGDHEMCVFQNKELTFVGEDKETTTVTDYVAKGSQMHGVKVHFENLTVNGVAENYYGLFHSAEVTYKDCNINGLRFLYAPTVSFEGCAFNAQGVEHSFWTYGASDITVKNCSFTYTDRAVNCYSESGASHETDIAFTGCTFTYAGTADAPEGAVEINSGSIKSIDLTMDDCIAPEKGEMWFNSQWDGKKGANTTVEVDGEYVWKPLKGTGTVEDPILINDLADLILFRDTVNTYTQDGSNQFKGKYVKLTADINLAGINWTPIGTNSVGDHAAFLGTFDGGDHTIYNLYINADGDHLGFFARVGSYAEDCTPTVKNLKFCNVDVSSNITNHWTTGHGDYVGGVIANAGGNSVVSNIEVTGDVYIVGCGYVGGIVGHGYPDLDNCHVNANDGSYVNAGYWCAGGIIGFAGEGGTPITNCSVSGLDIWSAYGAAAAVAGLLKDGNKVENVSASNVEITSDSDYCMGYIAGNGECSTMTNVTVENVTATAKGEPITATDAVASIGDKLYFDLDSAVNAGGEIKLLRNVVLTDTLTISAGKEVVLDLNGKTISQEKNCTASYEMIANNGKLTITGNGKISFTDTGVGDPNAGWGAYTIRNSGTLIVENGTIENLSAQNQAGKPFAHTTLAIFQYAGSTTINGGTISTPNYRSVRLWSGDMTINGGTFDGQVWVHCVNDTSKLTINGGEFSPNGNDGSSVFVNNNGKKAELTITDGNFATKIGADSPSTLEGDKIIGGTFTEAAVNGTNAALLGERMEFVEGENGSYGVAKASLKVSTKAELIDAVAAANPGDTIVLGADIDFGTDHLKIEKAITLDLGGKTLTTKARNYGLALYNGCTVTNGKLNHAGTVAAIKVWDAVEISDLEIDVTGTSASGYTIDGIVIQENAAGVDTIKNVKIYSTSGQGVDSGIKTHNCGNATEPVIGSMENVTVDAKSVGLNISAPCGTATNCSIKGGTNGIEIWIKGTYSASLDLVDCDVEGGVFAHDEFAANVTNSGTLSLTGVEAEDITLTINHAEESQVKGVLADVIKNSQAKVNGTYYMTIEDAIKAAQPGDTVTILAGDYTTNVSVNKAITVVGETDAEGNNLVKITGKLNITANGATVKNLNVNNGSSSAGYINAKDVLVEGCTVVGGNGFRNCYTTGTVTFKDSTITGSTYGIHFDGSAGGNIVIDSCVITGWTSFAKTIKKVTMTDTEFEKGNYNYVRFYQEEVEITGCTFNEKMKVDLAVNGAKLTVTNSTVENGTVEGLFEGADIVNSTITVDGVKLSYVAKIGNTYYATLEEALAAVTDYTSIKLVADATLDYNAREAYGRDTTTDIIIDGQGHTLTLNQKDSDWSSIGMKNAEGKLTLKNMTIEKTGYGDTSGAWNTHAIIFSCGVEMTDVTVNNGIAVQNGAALTNVTINEANGYYGLWINGNGQTVTVEGGSINATNGGRGIKIADQYIAAPASVTLSVTGTKFNTAKKAAVLVSSKAGADITASNVDITNVAEDTVNFVWVDEDWAADFGKVSVEGGSVAQESVESFNAVVMDGEKIVGYYKTLADAIKGAAPESTITLLADITENVTVNKNLTIDGADKNYTGTMTVSNGKTVTVQNVKFYNGGIVKAKGTTGTLTVKNCEFDGAGTFAYPVRINGATTVVVEDCTVTNYLYSFLYVSSGTNTVSVKNVTVENCPSYAIYFASGVNNAMIENLTVKNANNGIVINNTAARKLTIKDCKMENVATAINHANGTNTITCTLLGENDFGTAVASEYTNFVLPSVEDTLTAPEGLNVTTNAGENHVVVYENGTYKVIEQIKVTITVGDATMVAGNALPEFTYTYTSDVEIDGLTVALSTETDGKTAGEYAITATVTAPTDAKYVYTIVPGKLTVEGAVVRVYAKNDANVKFFANLKEAIEFAVAQKGNIPVYLLSNITVDETIVVNDTNAGLVELQGDQTGIRTYTITSTHAGELFKVEKGTLAVKNLKINAQGDAFYVTGGTLNLNYHSQGYQFLEVTSQTGNCVYIRGGSVNVNGAKLTSLGEYPAIQGNGNYAGNVTLNRWNIGDGTYPEISAPNTDIAIYWPGNGKLTVEGGKITGDTALYAKSGTIVINGGEFIADGAKADFVHYSNGAYATGDAVVIEACKDSAYETPIVTITGGTFTSANADGVKFYSCDDQADAAAVMEITGGTYSSAVAEEYCAEGYIPTKQLEDGTYSVILGKYVARNTTTGVGYETLAEAFAEAQDGNTVALLNAVAEDVTIDKNLTFDCGAYQYTGTITISANVVLTAPEGLNVITSVEDYKVNYENGTYSLIKATIAMIGSVGYSSLADAVAAAKPGQTIRLICDAEGAGVVIDKDLTINFGGHTYTITEPVGSAGTESNGFQILAGNKVALTDGTLKVADSAADKFYILIQNYSDLTVQRITLDGTNLDKYSKVENDGYSYVLSNNSGYVQIKPGTKFIVNDDGANAFAFDVCKFGNYPEPTVKLDVKVDKKYIDAVAYTGSYYFATLQGAVNNGGTITVLRDAAGPGVVFSNDVNINFGGYTYTITEPVGSTGTVSNGFQILSGNQVVLRNGTVKVADSAADKFYILIQNYADLSTSNITLDGTNLDKWSKTDGDSYTLSNNSGNVSIGAGTKIIANNEGDKAFAFDACKFAGYELPVVTVHKTAVIEGNIEAAAKIGNVYYATLQQAIDAAANGKTITLVSDINLNNVDTVLLDGKYNTYFKVEGKTITIDMNGKTISGEYTGDSMLVGVFSTDNNGHLTVTGEGTVNVTSAEDAIVYGLFVNYESGCSLTVENGTYTLDKASDSMLYSGCGAAENEGITVNGGKFILGNIGEGKNGLPWIGNVKGQNAGYIVFNGGTYNNDFVHQFWANEVFVPETKALKANGDGTWTIVDAEVYIIERGTSTSSYDRKVGYATFKDAVDSIKKGAPETTIGLNKNITVKGQFIGHSYAQKVNLDLNGYKMSSTDKALTVYRGGTEVTINNGTVHGNTTGGTIQVTYGGKLTLGENVTITSGGSATAIKVDANSTLIVDQDTAFVLGGKNDLVVADGAKVEISAGYFKQPVKAEWCAEGNIPNPEKQPNGYYTVMDDPAYGMVAQIGDSYFETLQAAIEAAKDNDTIIVLADITLNTADEGVLVANSSNYATIYKIAEKAITIDLNGKTIDVTVNAADVAGYNNSFMLGVFCLDANGELVLTGNGTVTANLVDGPKDPMESDLYALLVAYGEGSKLTVESGTFHANSVYSALIYSQYDEIVTINGGTYTLGNLGGGENGSPWIFNAKGRNEQNVIVNGGSFGAAVNDQYWVFEVQMPRELALKYNEETGLWDTVPAVAYVNNQEWSSKWYTNEVGYATIEEAMAAVDPIRSKTIGKNTYYSDPEVVTILNNGAQTEIVETNDVAILDSALSSGANVSMTEDMTVSASATTANSGYGATGVAVNGGTFNGNGKTLEVTGAYGTWDCAVNAKSGVIQNVTIKGAMRGIFMGGATGDVFINNVVVEDVIYTFNSDGGSKDYGVYISNTTLNGWTSFSDCHKEVVFTKCNFGEGSGYAFCRPYNASVFENCVFEEGFRFDTSKTSQIVFKNCYYGDTLITAENAASLCKGETVFFYNGLNGITIE